MKQPFAIAAETCTARTLMRSQVCGTVAASVICPVCKTPRRWYAALLAAHSPEAIRLGSPPSEPSRARPPAYLFHRTAGRDVYTPSYRVPIEVPKQGRNRGQKDPVSLGLQQPSQTCVYCAMRIPSFYGYAVPAAPRAQGLRKKVDLQAKLENADRLSTQRVDELRDLLAAATQKSTIEAAAQHLRANLNPSAWSVFEGGHHVALHRRAAIGIRVAIVMEVR